jgi:arylsulfatase A-like enzyme
MKPNRRSWMSALKVLICALVASGAGSGCSSDDNRPYNVLLVTLDTARADYFGCYAGLARNAGHPLAETPVFDALAAEGVRFDQGIATAAVTPVAHAAILTGRFNHEHQLRVMYANGGFRLPPGSDTLFTVLQSQGWHTGAFHSAFPVSGFFGLGEGFDVYETVESEMTGGNGSAQWGIKEAQRRSDDTTELALDFLEDIDEPFAMWVHYWDPHDTVLLPPGVQIPSLVPPADFPEDPAEQERVLEPIVQELHRGLYATELSYVDSQFGRLVESLKQSGEWERTIVIVVADHGEGLYDHGWKYHRVLYQEQIRVPYLLRVPGVSGGDGGLAVENLVRTIDLAPTVYDYLKVAGPETTGRSLRPLLEQTADAPRIALAEQINGYDHNSGPLLRQLRPQDVFVYCAMDDRWKLLYRPEDPSTSELFDLRADPLESENHYRVDHPDAVRLRKELAHQAPWVTEPFPRDKTLTAAQMAAAQAAIRDSGYVEGEVSTGEWLWACPVHMDQPNECERCSSCGEPPIPVSLR